MFSARRQVVSRAVQASRSLSTTAVDNGLGASELSLVVKAGARFEPAPGVAHLLQTAAFQDTAARSGLRLQREAELLGGSFTTQLTKEHLVLTAKFLREDLPYFVEALADTATKPLFREYQFDEDVVPLAKAEAVQARADPRYVAVENAYEVGFRRGLANSLLVSAESPVSLAQLKEYTSAAYTAENAQLVARNVNVDDLSKFAGADFAKLSTSSSLSSPQSQFYNGEARTKSAHPDQVAVLAFPTSTKPCLTALKYVLGGNNIKWSPGFGLLREQLPSDVHVSVHNQVFSDASFFYVLLKGSSASRVAEAVKTAAQTIKKVASGSLDETLAKKAIATAKFAEAEAEGTVAAAITPKADLAKVSAASISAAAKSLVEGKHVLSVVGRTYALPYSDELF